MKFDLHLHTCRYSPDATMTPEELVHQALAIGLDGIVITEHDRLWPESELNKLRSLAGNLTILAGVEITGSGGDMLCYGVQNLDHLQRGVSWDKLVKEVHKQGGVCVAAHPYRWNQPIESLLLSLPEAIDGLEMMSKNMDHSMRKKAIQLANKDSSLAQLGNSDAHETENVGCCYTWFDDPISSTSELVCAIRNRKCKPMENLR